MRRARPRDLRRVSGAVVAAAGGQPTGAAGRRPPIPPARSAPSAKPAAATPAPTAYGAYLVPDGGYDNMATAFHGRVFAQDRAGIYFCSGTAVTSRRRSVVFTAAHCVYNRRTGWARKFIFVPAFNRGRAPYGRWNWHSMFIPRRWLLRNDKFDYAAVAMRRTRGRKLQDVVGSAGFAWNARPRQDYRIFGYPFGRYRGKRMMTCYRPLALRISYRRQGPRPIGIRCPFKVGSSGGGWLIADQYLVSVSSFRVLGRRFRRFLFGPYFTREAFRLLRRAESS